MARDSTTLRARAARYREKAIELQEIARGLDDRKMIDAYTGLIAEYDLLAFEIDRLADEIG
jgi:hypothetical protein